ncbi:1-deoxy-D-xylulose-5-phosphate synthase [Paludicola sp. MB14-C6]|uniref:1-deoxy-D-xylulose-5-phosphate synthase n=1 Tax=Paludihabitans sp. MB14-C6 TaxID=3070656 RepID=UPI0027DB41B4|nr:1-deoxy-D-xylulose-5-phosphate synthase [Paludicola sp. MB14-C6]WMJ23035.1 1-deoxy-D-xylulose-5-phosphate synthase [Paludicola sp. MB14-C6]
MEYKLLNHINTPDDLKKLSKEQLVPLCEEIRGFLLESVSQTGGHLASNLGTVELTVALHKVFQSPEDKIVFDVGHQCYTHKLLTNRKEQFVSLRQKGGISGFPKPKESEHDAFIAGHSSTSISAALGIAKALQIQGKSNHAIAVIGDGAFTGGEAYEALNNAGRSGTNLILILNHNDMSISKNVGAFARYLATIRARPGYLNLKSTIEKILLHTPLIGKPIRNWLESSKSMLKTLIYRSTFFEELGFSYLGPTDGHDIEELILVLRRAKELQRPVLIQVETIKGKGYPFAEENPGAYHATATFDPSVGSDDSINEDTYSFVSGMTIKQVADEDNRICAITAAMKYATGLQNFYQAHKERFFDVGIAEQHAVTFAGGLASQGMIPVFAVYSSFLQRGYDQIIHDISIEQQHVVLAIDRAGIVGEDGETHQGIFDTAYLNHIPNVKVYSPEGYEETSLCMQKAITEDQGVVAVRYPRGSAKVTHTFLPTTEYEHKQNGNDTLVISYGRMTSNCFDAVQELNQQGNNISLLKLTQIIPLDTKVISIANEYKNVYFVEEAIQTGGIAEHFGALLLEQGYKGSYHIRAIESFVPQSSVNEAFVSLGLDKDSIKEWIINAK